MKEFLVGIVAIMLFNVAINITENRYSKNDYYLMGIALLIAFPLGKFILRML